MASSPSRRTLRARMRLATLEQAMMKTSTGSGEQDPEDGARAGGDLVAQADGV